MSFFFIQVRIQLKDHLDRMKKHKAQKEREEAEFQYSNSDDDVPQVDWFIQISYWLS